MSVVVVVSMVQRHVQWGTKLRALNSFHTGVHGVKHTSTAEAILHLLDERTK